MFIQDSVPAYGTKKTQNFLKDECYFLDQNKPCDYWLWSEVKKVPNNFPYNSILSLNTPIRRRFRSIQEGY